jgi:hypothetical protein
MNRQTLFHKGTIGAQAEVPKPAIKNAMRVDFSAEDEAGKDDGVGDVICEVICEIIFAMASLL